MEASEQKETVALLQTSQEKASGVNKKNFFREKLHYIAGIAAALLLLVFYLAILTFVNSFDHAISELARMWYFIVPLSIGFGMQVGLYFYIKKFIAERAATASVAWAGGLSGASMVACCAHHLTDFLPILGLSAAAIFLDKYQLTFILIALFSNFIGVVYMLSVMKKHSLFSTENEFLVRIFSMDFDNALKLSFTLGLALVVLSALFALNGFM